MATKKDLQELLEKIARHTGEATTDKEAQEKGLKYFISLDHYALYGGYSVVKTPTGTSITQEAWQGLCNSRRSAKQMYNDLYYIYNGIKLKEALEKENSNTN